MALKSVVHIQIARFTMQMETPKVTRSEFVSMSSTTFSMIPFSMSAPTANMSGAATTMASRGLRPNW